MDCEYVRGLGGGDAETLALAYGEVVDAGVSAEDFAGGSDELAGQVRHGLILLREVGAQEGLVVAIGDEADLLRVGLGGDFEAGLGSEDADVWLTHFTEGEQGVGELVLRQAKEEVGLILGAISGPGENPSVADGVKVVTRVVAGGDARRADLAGSEEELIELEVVVAEGAGDGGAAGEVLGDEGADDVGLEAVLLIDHVVGDVEAIGDVAGVVYVVDGAAATLGRLGFALRAGGVRSGKAALVPELKGEADDILPLGLEQCGYSRRIYPAGHGYGNGLRLLHGVLLSAGRAWPPLLVAQNIQFLGLSLVSALRFAAGRQALHEAARPRLLSRVYRSRQARWGVHDPRWGSRGRCLRKAAVW